nr:hypothetical protein Iba_chr09aCG13610 [Ipomoea batatas]
MDSALLSFQENIEADESERDVGTKASNLGKNGGEERGQDSGGRRPKFHPNQWSAVFSVGEDDRPVRHLLQGGEDEAVFSSLEKTNQHSSSVFIFSREEKTKTVRLLLPGEDEPVSFFVFITFRKKFPCIAKQECIVQLA